MVYPFSDIAVWAASRVPSSRKRKLLSQCPRKCLV